MSNIICQIQFVISFYPPRGIKIWKKLDNSLHNDHLRLFHKHANISHLLIHFFEECGSIVFEAHTSKIPHHGKNATQNIIKGKKWHVKSPHYRIPHKYIKIFYLQCSMCSTKKRPSPIKRKKLSL